MLDYAQGYDFVALETISDQASGIDFASFSASFSGIVTLTISLPTSSVLDLYVTPNGGSEAKMGALNDGTSMTAGAVYAFQFGVSKGANYALQVATTQSGDLWVHVTAGGA